MSAQPSPRTSPNAGGAPKMRLVETAASPYEQHRDYVLGVLRRRCGWLDASDQEAILHDAYAVFLEKQHAGTLDVATMHPQQVRAYLTQTALNKALDEGKRAHRKRSVALDDGGMQVTADEPEAADLLAQDYDGARLREIVAELPERQQTIIKLRFFFDRAPEEVQRYLGVTERVYRRDLERAMRTLTERFDLVRDGTFCESRRSLILAFVSGIAGPNRVQDARRHLASCPACASWAGQLRETARRAGALVPAPLVTADLAQRGDRLRGLGLGMVRDRLADLVGGAREHVAGLAARTDPTSTSLFAAVRPGTVAAVIAGCLTVGSTATYCALNGVPGPLRDLISASDHPHRRATPPAETSHAAGLAPALATLASAPAASVRTTASPAAPARSKPTSAVAHPHAAAHQQTTAQRRRAQAKRQERATAPEFGVEGSTPRSSSASTASGAAGSGAAPTNSTSNESSSSGTSSSSGGGGSGGKWGSEFGP